MRQSPRWPGMGLGCRWAVGKRPAARWRRIVEVDTPHVRAASAIVRLGRDHSSCSESRSCPGGSRSGWSPLCLRSGVGFLVRMTEVCHGLSGQS
jgi:hypothetical protein